MIYTRANAKCAGNGLNQVVITFTKKDVCTKRTDIFVRGGVCGNGGRTNGRWDNMAKTLIAVPCFDMVHTEFMQSLIALEKPENTSFTVVKNTLISVARNTIARNAIEAGFDRIMWFDSDMDIPRDALMKLTADMDNNPGIDMVTGLYFTRKTPIKPVIYSDLYWEKKNGEVDAGAANYFDYPEGLIPIAGCGFGCVLTSVDLIKRVWERVGIPFAELTGFGEDLSFCERVNRGFGTIWADTTVKCGHVGVQTFNEQMYRAQGKIDWSKQNV